MSTCCGARGTGRPITEMPNELTKDIDISDPIEIVRLLRQVDAQIFTGWGTYEGIYDSCMLASMESVVASACDILRDPAHNAVVLSGCGTSGRLAFITARAFNHHLHSLNLPLCYHYIIAGGDGALVKSVEAMEDSWREGVRALDEATQGKTTVLFVGITCGLSAPFVAGQLDYCLQHRERFIPVLLGFNREALSTPIRDWDKTFRDVVNRLREEGHGFLLNPSVGPEGITGSTRMKGGTATKMILETIFSTAHHRLTHSDASSLTSTLQGYELTYRHTYFQSVAIAAILETAAECLRAGGQVCYLGVGSLGLMSLLDASECPPTFGAAFDDVRGFVKGGYDTLGNHEGNISDKGPEYHLSWEDFSSTTLPHLTSLDCVIFVMKTADYCSVASEVRQLCESLCDRGSRMSCILVGTSQDDADKVDYGLFDCHVQVVLPWQPLSYYWSCPDQLDFLLEASVKFVLNAVSTGAHVLRGKVLGNRMADLRVSNDKLFRRAISIIQDFSEVTYERALRCLLSAIHNANLADHAHPLMPDDSTHLLVSADHTHPPMFSDSTHLPVSADHTHPPMFSDSTHLPVSADHTHPPMFSDSTHLPVSADHTHPPMFSDSTHLPVSADHTHPPMSGDSTHLLADHTHPPMSGDSTHLLADHTHPPMSGDSTHLLADHTHPPMYGDSTHLPADHTHDICIATARDKVVPVALLVSTGSYSVEEARQALKQNPIVRSLLAQTKSLSAK